MLKLDAASCPIPQSPAAHAKVGLREQVFGVK
jgi:hypothetical protein